MSHTKHRLVQLAATTALLAVLSVGCADGSGSPEPDPNTLAVATPAGPTLSASDHRAISRIALVVRVAVADAREDAQTHRIADATTRLDHALELTNTIDDLLPTAALRNRLRIAEAHLGVETPRDVLPDLVPVSGELERLAGEVAATEAREHLDRARTALEHGETTAAEQELEAVDASVVYPEVEVSLNQARRDLKVAVGQLHDGHVEAADTMLQAVEDGIEALIVAPSGQSRSAELKGGQ
jgi:hypothetical protein